MPSTDALKELLDTPPPNCMDRMPTPMFFMGHERGTINEFLLRADAEARDIVHEGDSLVKTTFFPENIGDAFLDFYKISKAYYESNAVPECDITVLQKTRDALHQISQYHRAKITASEQKIKDLQNQINQIRAHFEHAVRAKNVDTLLEYYPHWAELNDLEPTHHAIETPSGNIVNFQSAAEKLSIDQAARQIMYDTLVKCETENDTGSSVSIMNSSDFESWVGTPYKISDQEEWQGSCFRDIKRNGAILEAIESIIQKFDAVITPRTQKHHLTLVKS